MTNEFETKKLMCEIGRRIYQREMVAANDGNFSVKIDENTFLCTPTGVSKGFMTPDMICKVDAEGNAKGPTGKWLPSSEIKMHMRIYRERPDVTAVVHAHPTLSCAYSTAQPCSLNTRLTAEAYYIIGDIVNVPYKLMGTKDLAEIVSKNIVDHEVMLMENHGAIAVGATLLRAFDCMELLERAAQMSLAVASIPNSHELTQERIDTIIKMREGTL